LGDYFRNITSHLEGKNKGQFNQGKLGKILTKGRPGWAILIGSKGETFHALINGGGRIKNPPSDSFTRIG